MWKSTAMSAGRASSVAQAPAAPLWEFFVTRNCALGGSHKTERRWVTSRERRGRLNGHAVAKHGHALEMGALSGNAESLRRADGSLSHAPATRAVRGMTSPDRPVLASTFRNPARPGGERPLAHRIRAIVTIAVTKALPLTSPAYDVLARFRVDRHVAQFLLPRRMSPLLAHSCHVLSG